MKIPLKITTTTNFLQREHVYSKLVPAVDLPSEDMSLHQRRDAFASTRIVATLLGVLK